MANHHSEGRGAVHHHFDLDALTVPVLAGSLLTWPIWPWFDALWAHLPTPTAVYMGVSAAFMLFQMSDKLGLLERLKRRPKYDNPDEA